MFLLHYFSTMPGFNNQIAYEIDDKGERVIVKSHKSEKRVHVRFVNRTSRPVDVYWRDYNGHRRHYVTMKPRSYYNTDTFVTHPWEFSDAHTKERYVVNNKYVFRAPESLGNVPHRSTWYISVAVRSLLSTALLSIASKLSEPDQVDALGLPKPLADDLRCLIQLLKSTPVQVRM